MVDEKKRLRARMRATRRKHVESLPTATRALLFRRPPGPVGALVPPGATIGVYAAAPFEAPTAGYARWFAEAGHPIALPWFAELQSPMEFRVWNDPFTGSGLVKGPYGLQPDATAAAAVPDVAFIPLLAFTANGHRLGQGGGHYDRWLAAHPACVAIGLGWDCQFAEKLPREEHDIAMRAVVTPTRVWQGGE